MVSALSSDCLYWLSFDSNFIIEIEDGAANNVNWMDFKAAITLKTSFFALKVVKLFFQNDFSRQMIRDLKTVNGRLSFASWTWRRPLCIYLSPFEKFTLNGYWLCKTSPVISIIIFTSYRFNHSLAIGSDTWADFLAGTHDGSQLHVITSGNPHPPRLPLSTPICALESTGNTRNLLTFGDFLLPWLSLQKQENRK